ncbi:hypothetical protein [Falsochrobactrum ovis]|uniref:Uncharacterized protein n=1 Tax=Falsochrobactrum ovis TaxID=1293442 RepID=A0A364JV93_9HYPH|nr:hypothetical protein [Falsochrobactrum ovis]RAK29035.1 hypothetical protein C7374_10584 [Falsochrobactrum ovis]
MSAPKRTKRPWEKEMPELNKYDWVVAVGFHPAHKNSPRDLRVSNALMQMADGETNLMWATQQTIAQYADVSDVRQVRTSLQRLSASGAVVKRRIADLQPDMLEALTSKMNSNRNKRGAVYTLRMFWALETFEACGKRQKVEPAHLRKSRERNRTSSVLNNRTSSVLQGQDCRSPAYTTYTNYNDTKAGFERNQDLASTYEGNGYARAKAGG